MVVVEITTPMGGGLLARVRAYAEQRGLTAEEAASELLADSLNDMAAKLFSGRAHMRGGGIVLPLRRAVS